MTAIEPFKVIQGRRFWYLIESQYATLSLRSDRQYRRLTKDVAMFWCYSCVPDVRIAEIHPQGRYIKLRNTSKTQVSRCVSDSPQAPFHQRSFGANVCGFRVPEGGAPSRKGVRSYDPAKI